MSEPKIYPCRFCGVTPIDVYNEIIGKFEFIGHCIYCSKILDDFYKFIKVYLNGCDIDEDDLDDGVFQDILINFFKQWNLTNKKYNPFIPHDFEEYESSRCSRCGQIAEWYSDADTTSEICPGFKEGGVNKWISCKSKKPESNDWVIVYAKKNGTKIVTISRYYNGKWFDMINYYGGEYIDWTCWMPLPKPPGDE